MKVYIVVGVDEPCAYELKAFKTEEEAEKYAGVMNDSRNDCMIWHDVQEVEVAD